jgi:hypothetical protein
LTGEVRNATLVGGYEAISKIINFMLMNAELARFHGPAAEMTLGGKVYLYGDWRLGGIPV